MQARIRWWRGQSSESGPVSGPQSRYTRVPSRCFRTRRDEEEVEEAEDDGREDTEKEEEKENEREDVRKRGRRVEKGRGREEEGKESRQRFDGGTIKRVSMRMTCEARLFYVLLLLSAVTLSSGQFRCPEPKGFFADPEQCDLYYVCTDGKAEEKLCKDGLVFRDDNPKKELCDLPGNIPCGDRTILQEPQPSKGCPRANGYFKHEDPNSCDRFVNCIDGVAQIMPCPPGLIYEDKMKSCVWPADASRLCENANRDVLDDGFVCPDGDVAGPLGRILPHPTYPHPEDCAKFYICKNGVVPQKGQCDYGTVYNEESFRCTEPDNVPGCEDYYKNKN